MTYVVNYIDNLYLFPAILKISLWDWITQMNLLLSMCFDTADVQREIQEFG